MSSQILSLKQHFPAVNSTKNTWGKTMKQKLDKYETEIEKNISQFQPVDSSKKELIENIIAKANEKKSISLRLKSNDLELLKRRADSEGLPYQTLLSSIVQIFLLHNY